VSAIRFGVFVGLIVAFVAYTVTGAALALNAWNLAARATGLPHWFKTRTLDWRIAGVGMSISGLVVLAFLTFQDFASS
jgi:hypothetical protein